MKKFILTAIAAVFSTFVILTVLSSTAHAGGIPMCERQLTAEKQAWCTKMALDGGNLRLKQNYDRIMTSTKIPQSKKDELPGTHARWANKMNKACSSDDVGCHYEWLSARNNLIERFMNHYGVDPF